MQKWCEYSHPCWWAPPGAPGGTAASLWVSWPALFSPEVDVRKGQRCSVWEALMTRFLCPAKAWRLRSWCFPWRENWRPGRETRNFFVFDLSYGSTPYKQTIRVHRGLKGEEEKEQNEGKRNTMRHKLDVIYLSWVQIGASTDGTKATGSRMIYKKNPDCPGLIGTSGNSVGGSEEEIPGAHTSNTGKPLYKKKNMMHYHVKVPR